MSEKALSDVEEDTKSTKDETVVQEYVNPGYTKQGDPRLRLDTGKEHVTFRRKWWQLWCVSMNPWSRAVSQVDFRT